MKMAFYRKDMVMTHIERDPARLFAAPAVNLQLRDDGSMLLSSRQALLPHARSIGTWLEQWAASAPDRPFLLERASAGGPWQGVTYGEARKKVRQIASALLAMDLKPGQPVAVLSDNGVEHALLMLACLHVGIPYAAISPAYSLMSKDHAKLKSLIQRLQPAVLYTAPTERFAGALAAISGLHGARLIASAGSASPPGAAPFSSLLGTVDNKAVEKAHADVGPDTVAKILFTSGSIAEPKGVVNTQRMLCASQQAKAQVWPFLAQTPPVIVDWLPWNHTFGGNHNLNLVLMHGGTLYVDAGKPMPGLFDTTIANLREIAPTIYFNVPRGFDMLVTALRADADLRRKFFSRLQVMFYAGSALPQNLWEALLELSRQETGEAVPMVTAWGSTETSPLATDCHFQAPYSGVIGVPVPGVELKLLKNGGKLEIRVRGPNVMPGYLLQPELTAKAFDEEGFYRIGDAVRFADPQRPEAGLVFDGRVAEDFKLASGTWVNVGALRVRGIEFLAPVAQDIVVTGHDGDEIGFLVFPNMPACRQLAALPAEATAAEVLMHDKVRTAVSAGLAAMRAAGSGSSTFAGRALLLQEPPSVDAGEITDKGYINQAAVLRGRAVLAARLHALTTDPETILPRL
ncbi:MAG: feruloyl-CoA synthase [Herminiimonas sp.]|nr:feruloyl-CoA synthase [Herminiimonas sp.]